jgi:hypothetical protein
MCIYTLNVICTYEKATEKLCGKTCMNQYVKSGREKIIDLVLIVSYHYYYFSTVGSKIRNQGKKTTIPIFNPPASPPTPDARWMG